MDAFFFTRLGPKMKLVLISQSASPGIMIFRKDFIQYMVGRGVNVYCLAIDYTKETKRIVEGWGAIPVDYTLNRAGLNPLQDLRDVFRLAKLLRSIQPDVVFSFFVKPSLYGTLAAKMAGVPRRIALLEGLGYIHTPSEKGDTFKKKLLRLLHGVLSSACYFFANQVLFLNHDDPKDLSRSSWLNQNKLKVIGPIGLDLSVYNYSPVRITVPVRFIFIARLLAEKGVFEYLAAARLVKKHHPDTEFVVLGGLDPENPAALTPDQLQEVVDEGLIIYPGHVHNVQNWISDSHVFVLPSYREGFPRSTQEAMAIGRAVITSNVAGCRETVVDGENGFLVPLWDPLVLANRMMYLIKRPEQIRRMGDESHRLAVERFDVNKINPILADILIGAKR